MLCELRIKNLALIEALELSFDQDNTGGLVVMTGETGAGKSIMLRAIHLLSGGRAVADWVRNGAESCEVEALFEVSEDNSSLLDKLAESGFGRDPVIVVRRIVSANGRSRFYVNGQLATARIVADLAVGLLNVASQHDQQQLLQPALHLEFLDLLGDLGDERERFAEMYQTWREKREQLTELRRREQEKEQRQDFLRFQVSEIREAALAAGEEELLVAEKKRLKNAQSLIKVSDESYHLLGFELQDALARLRQNVVQLASLDPDFTERAENISGFTFIAEDLAQEMRNYRDSLEDDPYRLEKVAERLDLIQQLKRKYGQSIEEILEFASQGEEELQLLDNMDKEIGALVAEVARLEAALCKAAASLSEKRHEVAREMETAMGSELASLAFQQAGFVVQWQEVAHSVDNLRPTGWDRGEFFFSPNPGEPPRPLAKIASGGELSRLMLAMKCLLARRDMVETVIFDEVDTGIGGEAAEAVARKIQELAGHHQVFCITHLPQIAARGTLHFKVAKQVDGGRTQSAVSRLSAEERVKELVRMLAGDSATPQTRAWAEDLLVKGRACA